MTTRAGLCIFRPLGRAALVASFLFAASSYSGEPDLPGDYAKLQGRWVVFACERDGAAMSQLNGHAFTYEAKTVRLDNEEGRENYVLHEDTNPKGIEYLDGHNPAVLGIYKFDGDTLVTCTADPGRDRLSSFSTARGDGRTLIQTRRAK